MGARCFHRYNMSQVFVRDLTGKRYNCKVNFKSGTIENLKECIFKTYGIPVADQVILFAAKKCEDKDPLAQFREDPRFLLRIRKRGASPDAASLRLVVIRPNVNKPTHAVFEQLTKGESLRQEQLQRHPFEPSLLVRNCFGRGSDLSIEEMTEQFLKDLQLRVQGAPADLINRAMQRARNLNRTLTTLPKDLTNTVMGLVEKSGEIKAGKGEDDVELKIMAYNRMSLGIAPLGFTKDLFNDMCTSLVAAIRNSTLWKKHPLKFKLIFTGSSTTFYTENPDKNTSFDSKGAFKSDIDVGVQIFGNLEERTAFFKEVEQIPGFAGNQSPNQMVKNQQVSVVNTFKAFNLKAFNEEFGPHEYQSKQSSLLATSKTKRNVNVVILKDTETKRRNGICKTSIIWDSDGGNTSVLTPPPK